MDFLVGLGLTLLGIGLATVLYLSLKELLNWFVARHSLVNSDEDNICATIKTSIEEGNYQLVQGVFNLRTGEALDSRTIEADEIDDEIKELHRDAQIVVYEV